MKFNKSEIEVLKYVCIPSYQLPKTIRDHRYVYMIRHLNAFKILKKKGIICTGPDNEWMLHKDYEYLKSSINS